MRWIVAILLFSVVSEAAGQVTVLPLAASVELLYQKSAVVVLAQISTGELLPNHCGVSYTAKILERYKGNSNLGKTVSFYSYNSIRLGANYILFLGTAGHPFDNIVAYTGNLANATSKHISVCGKAWPPFTVNMAGFAALRVVPSDYPNGSTALFNSFSVVAPTGVSVTKPGPMIEAEQKTYSDAMNLGELKQYLYGLSQHK